MEYCYKNVFRLVSYISELRRTWRRRGEDVKEFGVLLEGGIILASSNKFHFCLKTNR